MVANTSKSWPSRLFSPNKNGCHWVWLLFAICLDFCFVFFTFCLFFKTLMALLSSIKFHYHVLFKLCICDLITTLEINSEVKFLKFSTLRVVDTVRSGFLRRPHKFDKISHLICLQKFKSIGRFFQIFLAFKHNLNI